jgi:hypothetical protein
MVRTAVAAFLILAVSTGIAAEPAGGFDSPVEAFRAYLLASAHQDYDQMLATLTRESRAHHLALAVFSAEFLFSQDPEMRKVLAEHLPGEKDLQGLPEDEERRIVEVMARIKNPGQLLAKIGMRHDQLARQVVAAEKGKGQPGSPAAQTPDTAKRDRLLSDVRIDNLKMEGDSASAVARVPGDLAESLSSVPGPLRFRRVGGRWFCDLDPR